MCADLKGYFYFMEKKLLFNWVLYFYSGGTNLGGCAAQFVCTYNNAADNNICNGDNGVPLYQYSYADKKITQTVVGIAIGSDPLFQFCLNRHLGAFDRVATHIAWIEEVKTAFGVA